jgi:hypothetical protein
MMDGCVVTGSRDGKLSWWAEPVESTCKQDPPFHILATSDDISSNYGGTAHRQACQNELTQPQWLRRTPYFFSFNL